MDTIDCIQSILHHENGYILLQLVNTAKKNLTVAAKAEGVVPLPGGRLGGVVVAAAFPKSTVLFSNTSETASLPALVHRLGDPVDPRIAANLYARISKKWGKPESLRTYSLVVGVNEDDLVIFIDAVLVNPVRVQYSQVTTTPTDALLCNTP